MHADTRCLGVQAQLDADPTEWSAACVPRGDLQATFRSVPTGSCHRHLANSNLWGIQGILVPSSPSSNAARKACCACSFKGFDEVRRLGLRRTTEAAVHAAAAPTDDGSGENQANFFASSPGTSTAMQTLPGLLSPYDRERIANPAC